ncbi:MAG: orotidine-5'-phosphate decarboxylase [Anaerosomatales bacterium]|nr:orotidine-5'-phosphate decarboxylase [Anaerosomatales bacterium]
MTDTAVTVPARARDALIVALDLPERDAALAVARDLKGRCGWVKVGMTLYDGAGPDIVRELRALGFKVFVDLKLHDIPHQVRGACGVLVRQGANLFTVHASGGRAMLEAAASATAAAAERFGVPRPAVIAVTVLTSLDDAALAEMGFSQSAGEHVAALAALARDAGVDGVVCSPAEAAGMRALLGPEALVVTPGVRPSGAETGDQSRVATPAEAIAAGASHLVVGRPVTEAPSPGAAADAIVAEIETAIQGRE